MNDPSDKFAAARQRMVQEQLVGRGLRDRAVLRAMNTVPREHFVPPKYLRQAYSDSPIPIAAKQTISQPYVVALMCAMLQLKPQDRVLEIGTGSGYAAAVLSRIVQAVYTVERHKELVTYARQRLAELGYDNVHVRQGDGTLGWPEHAPYDGIVVAAGGPHVPLSLRRQLALNGRLVMPVGKQRKQRLVRVVRKGENKFSQEQLGSVRFVPLIGEEGWE